MKKMAASEYERALREETSCSPAYGCAASTALSRLNSTDLCLECQDWDEEWGDRRQEIVFIGQRLDEARNGKHGLRTERASQAAIREMLDECLLTDAEQLSFRSTIVGLAGIQKKGAR